MHGQKPGVHEVDLKAAQPMQATRMLAVEWLDDVASLKDLRLATAVWAHLVMLSMASAQKLASWLSLYSQDGCSCSAKVRCWTKVFGVEGKSKLSKLYGVRRLSRTCHPLIRGKRASRDPNPEVVRKGCGSSDSNAGPRDGSKLPYRTWHPWAAGWRRGHGCHLCISTCSKADFDSGICWP